MTDNTDIFTDIDNEIVIQKEIAKVMHRLVSEGIISHFVVTDDDYNTKQKALDTVFNIIDSSCKNTQENQKKIIT